MSEPDLLVTKFTVPPLRSVLLDRSHLLTVLEQSRSFPLTLLSASAGFGKTTLLSVWANQSTSRIAWLSLDTQDNDPARFWAYVVAALRKADTPLGEAAEVLLHAPQPFQQVGLLTSLINNLAALAQDITLILDDYHLIDSAAIHESLQFLLDHLPACLHVCLASRSDPPLPLARLRAKGQVIEIRETDLCLSSIECASFLKEVMGLSLSAEHIARLEQRTEGWIAGLQLATLALRRHDDASAFIEAFAGSHRLILDYVQEEILESLPEDQQRFLLYTSVLERMNAEICQRLSGEPASQQMLEELERAHLFLVPLDEERCWYRLHTLFREVLLARLQAREPEQVPRLQREAALWYQQQRWLHEAIPHALATQDYRFVAELLEGCVEHLGKQGEFQTLLTWIKLLPQEVLSTHPHLATSYILAFYLLFPFTQQQQKEQAYLKLLQQGVEKFVQGEDQTALPPAEQDRLRHRLLILQAWNRVSEALSYGNVEQLNSVAEQMQHLSLDDDAMWRLHHQGIFAIASRLAGDFLPMMSAIQELRKIIRTTQNHSQEIHILWGLIVALIALGQLSQARDHCEELRQLAERLGGPLPVAAYPDVFQAQLAYEWNQLEIAKSAARKAIERTAPLQYMDILMPAYEVLVRVYIAQNDLAGAQQALREMEQVHRPAVIPIFRPWIEGLQVQIWLAQGKLAGAVDWAEHTPYLRESLAYSREISSLTLARVYLAQQKYPQALQLLADLLNSAEQVGRVGSIIAIRTLQVATLQASGETQEMSGMLDRLLTEASPEEYLRVFLDAGEPMHQALQAWLKSSLHRASPALISYAQTVSAAFACEQCQIVQQEIIPPASRVLPSASSQSAQQLLELLTPREQEVLHLLAEGATNREIADCLVVSLATAKKHVASILSKLGAENRTQAIARARARAWL